jgi:hypothetical protein
MSIIGRQTGLERPIDSYARPYLPRPIAGLQAQVPAAGRKHWQISGVTSISHPLQGQFAIQIGTRRMDNA